ncbi:polysaccharide lyase family 7 protein [Rubinisphaera margarita]|uniref:polysaccharide lyase family 7 protein n=1 Tax=Rubinisphaera margarita TaxID=2909586 RepID=UPI001EE7E602|nr:polysaccharide lyase family 7 protein [Rubinisphaera margarita]MCG6154195.1 polysaccharide lyase family 7 protein [Rubinisphaera margarita]
MLSRSRVFGLIVLFSISEAFASAAEPPGRVFDLSAWKLTVPVDGDQDGKPDEILQPELQDYRDPECFFMNPADDAIVFRGPCGGVPTKNSGYPRCELREMTSDGGDEIGWSTTDSGSHVLELELAIKQLPEKKKHVVCAQIHDQEDDILMVRLERNKLFVERNDIGDVLLDSDYQLGDRVKLRIEAGQGRIRVSYNGEQKLDWKVSKKRCYFKAGCYTQSNVKQGDRPEAYAEVWIYALHIQHHGKTTLGQ